MPFFWQAQQIRDPEAELNFDQLAIQFSPVTALPQSPSDGQECYYIADSTNGVIWHLKYNAAGAGSYKWWYVGGPPLFAAVDTDEALATGTAIWVNLATDGPTITLPLGGDFMWRGHFDAYAAVATTASAGASINNADPAVNFFMDAPIFTNGAACTVTSIHRTTGRTAADTVKLKYLRNPTQAFNFRWRTLEVTPIRVG